MTAFATAVIAVATAELIAAPPGATAATPSATRKPTGVTPRRAPRAKAVLAQTAPTPTPTPTPTPVPSPTATPLVVGVAIFPAAKSNLQNASLDNTYYDSLAFNLNHLGPFHAWTVDKGCTGTPPCNVGDARIYIYGQETAAVGSKPGALTLTSFFASAAEVKRIDSVSLPISTTVDGKNKAADLSSDQIRALVGHLVLDDQFQVTINLPESETALQLVPSPVNASDPDYEPILEHILGTFGMPAVRSRLSASSLRGPGDSTTCPGAQRYFVYRVRLEEYPHKLLGHTRLSSYAEGFILDCTAPYAAVAASGRGSHDLPTTSTLLTDLSAFVVALYPKATSRQMTLGVNAFSKLVDVDPRSEDVRDSVAAASLSQLANSLCSRLLMLQPSASPSPSPLPAGQAPSPSPSPAPSSSPGVMPRASAEPLLCKKRLPYRPQSRGPAPANESYETLYNRWFHVETPTPQPKGSTEEH